MHQPPTIRNRRLVLFSPAGWWPRAHEPLSVNNGESKAIMRGSGCASWGQRVSSRVNSLQLRLKTIRTGSLEQCPWCDRSNQNLVGTCEIC